jgi:hypothetical protein
LVCRKQERDRDVLGREVYWEVRMTVNLIKVYESRMVDKNEQREYIIANIDEGFFLFVVE